MSATPPDGVPPTDGSAHLQVSRLMDGYLATQLLYVAAKLGIADALASRPLAADALARCVGAELDALRRVLRGLAAEGVLDEHPDGRFGLTALGSCLRGDVSSSLRGAIIARGDLYYGAATGLLEAVQHGGVPFEHVHNVSFFKYLAQHPERGVEFQASMVDRSRQEAAEVVAAYDFGSFGRLVDVGGGHGVLLTEILRAVPRLQAVLLDRLPVVERARERLEVAGLAGRCKFVAGDFFEAVPPGDDAAYVLSRVIHDWDDEVPASITTEGMGPCLAVEGATTGEVFEAYLEHFLAPALRPGQVVEMDNLSAHKGGRVRRELVEGRGCELLYLPPYSPDYNPIEQAFSKLKGLLRRAGARTREALVEAMGRALEAVATSDAQGLFESCGYRATAQLL